MADVGGGLGQCHAMPEPSVPCAAAGGSAGEASALLCSEAAPAPAGPLSAPHLVTPCQRGLNSNNSTVQNVLPARVPGREKFASSEDGLGFDFGLAMVDSFAAFPGDVEGYAIGQASHRQQPCLFHQIDL